MIGTRLGSWVLSRELGRGGMGCVYLARREIAGEPQLAAVKMLSVALTHEPGFLQRFQREIEVLRKLDHPNIVRLYESGIHEGQHYYIMEYVGGSNFEAAYRARGRLPWSEVVSAAIQVCQALKHAHDHGVIHRDLKPSNLLRADTPMAGQPFTVKLTDFGIAWVFAGEHMTRTGAIVGTAEYISPEQAAGKSPTRRSDLYSLGAVLYTLLVGRPPFEGEPLDLLHKHRYGQYERLSRLVPDIPAGLEEIVDQLLQKEPDRRPPDAAVLQRRLEALQRKMDYRTSAQTQEVLARQDTDAGEEERMPQIGPATLAATVIREELNQEKYGGPVRRFFNHPVVLLSLFLATVALIAWAFWPASEQKLYERGLALVESDPETAWEEYFRPLLEKYPDTPRRAELEQYRQRAEEAREQRQETRNARLATPASEAQWFYQKGLRLRQEGKTAEAEKIWRALVEAFKEVPSASVWVKWAEDELKKPSDWELKGEKRWKPVRQALERAASLEKEGNPEAARKIRDALRELYRGDPTAREVLKE